VVERTNQYILFENQRIQKFSGQISPNVKSILEKSKNTLELRKEQFFHVHRNFLNKRQQNLKDYTNQLFRFYEHAFQKNLLELKNYKRNTRNLVKTYIKSQKKYIENLNKANEYLDPKNILKRGFSITQNNNHPIKTIKEVKYGDTIKTFLYEGKLVSQISCKEENDEHQTK
jgi:exodeoxyribonuclease VII large subunit